jgi:Ca2+-binding RTX toxin-like protein
MNLLQTTQTAIGVNDLSAAKSANNSISANFSAGQLSVTGTTGGDSITISRNAAGTIQINGGAVKVQGGVPTVANTTSITAYGREGADTILLDESNGALPAATLFGGAGNDTLGGGSGADKLYGQADNDTLMGRAGNDLLFGGSGDDVLVGGDGNDMLYGEDGNDRLVWNPGDDSDLFEGGAGSDTAEVHGGNGTEVFTLTANGTRVRFDRIDPAPFALDIGSTEQMVLNMNGGDDQFSATGNLAALIGVSVDGGAGNDTILGSNGADTLLGGDGNDFVDGNQGNDTVVLGAGDDIFGWDPGDGSDTVDGGVGIDTLRFNGSNIGEQIALSAGTTGGARLTRDIGVITTQLANMERIDLATSGGTDTVTLADLTGTGVQQVNVALAAFGGGGDAAIDTVVANGGAASDTITVSGDAAGVAVLGLAAQVLVTGADATDNLVVNGGAGSDTMNASALVPSAMRVTLDGGANDDTLIGSFAADTLLGGDGNDLFVWNPGHGNDTVEGQDGSNDVLRFTGSNIGEAVGLYANGGRVLLNRDVAAVTLDVNGVERIELALAGGSDAVTIGDLTGTGVGQVRVDLSAFGGGSDGVADTIIFSGSSAAETLTLATGATGGVVVANGTTQLEVVGADAALDQLTVYAGLGDDTVDASALSAGSIGLNIQGGLGIDTITGSQGNDVITGGDGNDVVAMAGGDDLFVWNPGDDSDTVNGGTGFDTLRVSGANIAETINIGALGDAAHFTRDIATVAIDARDVEVLRFTAAGGSDTIIVGDLTSTAVERVEIDLGTFGGVADGVQDIVKLSGTAGDDMIQIVGDGSGVWVFGLGADVYIEHFDAGVDSLLIEGLGGNDVIQADGMALGTMYLVADGGDGDDVLLGSAGVDALFGGDGNDVLLGGPGSDWLDGGTGDNIVIQD